MTTVTLEEAQARLPDLIERLAPGSEVVITRNQQPIARLRAEEKPKRKPRRAGNCRGKGVCLLFGKLDNFRVCLFSQNGRRLEWRTNGALRGTWSQRWPQSTWLPHFNNMEADSVFLQLSLVEPALDLVANLRGERFELGVEFGSLERFAPGDLPGHHFHRPIRFARDLA
jgi:antitoxin (DNA-binding transcriptional repressor) of toxin-antitoxin stability system